LEPIARGAGLQPGWREKYAKNQHWKEEIGAALDKYANATAKARKEARARCAHHRTAAQRRNGGQLTLAQWLQAQNSGKGLLVSGLGY